MIGSAIFWLFLSWTTQQPGVPDQMTKRPAVGPLPEMRLAKPARFVLKNKLEVIAVPRRTAPLVALQLVVRSGADADPADLPGLAAATADMLDEGAGARSAMDIAAALEQLGAELTLVADRDGSRLSLVVPSAGFERALAIVADVVLTPRFDEADWQRVQNDRATSLILRRDRAEEVARVVADRVVFGDEHPYGHPVDGFEKSVRKISVADLRRFHAERWRPDDAALVLAGDLNPARVRTLVDKAFGGWKRNPARPSATDGPGSTRRLPRLVLVDKPGAPQTVVTVIGPGVPRSSPDRAALSLLNTVLGGSFTSRLNFNLRETKGYTYGARSSFAFLRRPGSFSARSSVFTKVTDAALGEMLKELKTARSSDLTAEEVTKGRAILTARVSESLATVPGTAEMYAEVALYRLPLDEPERFARALAKVEAAEARRAAGKILDADAMAIVLVGDRTVIEPGLKALGLPAAELRDTEGDRL